MTLRVTLTTAIIVLAAGFSPAVGQILYWDTNGATAGSTNTPPDAPGTWDGATANWNLLDDGTGATQAWTSGSEAVFSAGADASGTINVALGGTQSASGVWFQEGAVTVSGGTGLTLTGAGKVGVGLVGGDYNANGIVDAADYVMWRKDPVTFGGDPAGYDTWKSNFGSFTGPATTATINSVIGGSVGLNKIGTGTLVLSGANTYSGNTVFGVNSGTIKVEAANSLPVATPTVVTMPTGANMGARLELSSGVDNMNQFEATIGGLSGGGTGTVTPTIVVVPVNAKLNVNVPNTETYTYSGLLQTDYNISNDDHGSIVKNGGGTLNLVGTINASFQGEFILNEGTVGIGNNQSLGPVTSTNKLTINGGKLTNATSPNASLNLAVRTVDINDDVEFDANGASNTQFIGAGGNMLINLKDNATITVNPQDPLNPSAGGVLIFAGQVSDGANSFGLTKAGLGTLTLLNGSNDYQGETTISAGNLRVTYANPALTNAPAAAGRMGDGTGAVNLAGGTLQYNGAPSLGATAPERTITYPNPVKVTANSRIAYTQTTLNLGATNNISMIFSNNSITGTGGTLTFVNEGSCTDNGNTCIFRPTFTGTGFSFDRPMEVLNHTTVATRSTVLTFANTTGTQTWSGVISGTGSLMRDGAGGTTILSGNNTYTGNTIVQAGTLSITNPFLADAADVLLTTGAIFDLNFVGTDTIDQLFIDAVSQAIGTWGAIGSGATNESTLLTGTGLLQVSSPGSGASLVVQAVPEPGAACLAIVAVGLLFGSFRSRARH